MICAETAHINIDECGAPERIAGLKLLAVPTPDGKLTPELIDVAGLGLRATSTTRSRASSRSPRPPSSARSTRPTRSRAIADARPRAAACRCTSTARASPTPPPPSACRCARSPTDVGVDVLSASAARRTALLYGEADRRAQPRRASAGCTYLRKQACSSPRRCASSARSSRRCSAATCGCAAPRTRTRWRIGWPLRRRDSPACSSSRAARRTRCSRSCPPA